MTAPPGLPRPSLEDLLGRYRVERPPRGSAGAAVAIVLRTGRADVEVLLIERTTDATDPASGQVAFPGGRVAEGDGNLLDTAFRELEEEVGLHADDLEGELRYVSTEVARRFGVSVAVFAGRLGPRGRAPVPRSPQEVAHVFWLPTSALSRTARVERETPLGLAEVDATVFEGHVLWGFTRRVLSHFLGAPTGDEGIGPAFGERSPPST